MDWWGLVRIEKRKALDLALDISDDSINALIEILNVISPYNHDFRLVKYTWKKVQFLTKPNSRQNNVIDQIL